MEEAFAQIQTLKGYQRDYLVSLVDVLISKDCDLTRWKDYFKSIGLLECATNTNIFVSFLNCGRHDEAREMIGVSTANVDAVPSFMVGINLFRQAQG